MKRLLAWVSIITALSAFVLFSLIFVLHIKIIIPIILFAVALVLLYVVKRMPSDETGISMSKPNDTAFYDNGASDGDAVPDGLGSSAANTANTANTASTAGKSGSMGKKG